MKGLVWTAGEVGVDVFLCEINEVRGLGRAAPFNPLQQGEVTINAASHPGSAALSGTLLVGL